MPLIDAFSALLTKLGPEATNAIESLVSDALTSDDPNRLIQRRLAATAAHEGAQAALQAALHNGTE
jgi:hypothetical protein